jgi:hypothetical protein
MEKQHILVSRIITFTLKDKVCNKYTSSQKQHKLVPGNNSFFFIHDTYLSWLIKFYHL